MIRQLRVLLKPWANPRAINEVPQAIVEDLLVQQQRLERDISRSAGYQSGLRIQTILFLIMVGLATTLFLTVLSISNFGTEKYWLQNLGYAVISGITRSSLETRLGAMAVAAWLLGTVVLGTAFRR